MPPRVVDAQQAIASQDDIEVRAGHYQAGNIALLIPFANAAGQFAGLVITQHDPIAGIRRENIIFAHRKAGKPCPLAEGFPGRQALALAVEYFHVIARAGVNRPIARHGHTARRGAEVTSTNPPPLTVQYAHIVARRDIHAVLWPNGDAARLRFWAGETSDLRIVDELRSE